MTAATLRVAVFGGSFDPPHIGHVLCAAYALAMHDVDRVLVVPADAHPFGKQLSPFADRLAMCGLAMRHLRDVEISDIARTLGGQGRTLDLLQALRTRMPGAALRLLIGSDIEAEVDRWHRFDEVAKLAPPLVVPRAGHVGEDAPPALPEVSSTEVRARLRDGGDVRHLVPAEVAAYARAHGLYAGRGD